MPNIIYIYGDSHTGAFLRAAKLLESNFKDTVFKIRGVAAGRIQDEFVLKTMDDKPILNPALTVCMQKDGMYPFSMYDRSLKKQGNIKIFMLFGSGLPHRLLASSHSLQRKFFEFYTSDETPEPQQVIPVLKDMLKEELKLRQNHFFHGLELLKEQGFNDIVFLSSPPLHRDVNYLIEKRPGLKPIMEELGLEPKSSFASDHFRSVLYDLSEEVIQEKMHALNYTYLSSPISTMDEQGFLKSEYYYDGLHANEQYGLEFAVHMVRESS